VPLLNLGKTSKAETMSQIEEKHISTTLLLDHSQFRRETWEPLRDNRSKNDTEYCLSESVPDAAEIDQQKKDVDKFALNAIRLSIINHQHEKVFSFIDGMHFNQSMKLVVRMCEELRVPALASKVLKYLKEKETKETFEQQMEKSETASIFGS